MHLLIAPLSSCLSLERAGVCVCVSVKETLIESHRKRGWSPQGAMLTSFLLGHILLYIPQLLMFIWAYKAVRPPTGHVLGGASQANEKN